MNIFVANLENEQPRPQYRKGTVYTNEHNHQRFLEPKYRELVLRSTEPKKEKMGPPFKRRKLEKPQSAVEEVIFDPSARQDFLTGFHKRKLARAKHAQELAVKRAREEKIQDRKKLREERKTELEQHVRQVNALLKLARVEREENVEDEKEEDGSENDWSGIEDEEPPPIDHEAEYIDEERYTTVTVEAMDVSKDGLVKIGQEDGDEDGGVEDGTKETQDDITTDTQSTTKSAAKQSEKRKWSKDKPGDKDKKPKKKRKNFRYENKSERKVTRVKQRTKNSKQAAARRAG